MNIGDIIGNAQELRDSAKPHIPREVVIERRRARRAHRKELETREWDAPITNCGDRNPVPGYKGFGLKERGTAKPAKGRWIDPPEWVVDKSKELKFHPITGETLAPCPNVGPTKANECAAIPSGMRKKHFNKRYRLMSWNDMVQHGIMRERE